MKALTTSDLRSQTGPVIDRVLADEIVRITRHGRTVAYLVSARAAERAGLVTPPTPEDETAGRGLGPDGEPTSATVREIADQVGVSIPVVARHVSDLVGDPKWGREKVIAANSDSFGGVLIHKEAAIHIAELSLREHRQHQEAAREGQS